MVRKQKRQCILNERQKTTLIRFYLLCMNCLHWNLQRKKIEQLMKSLIEINLEVNQSKITHIDISINCAWGKKQSKCLQNESECPEKIIRIESRKDKKNHREQVSKYTLLDMACHFVCQYQLIAHHVHVSNAIYRWLDAIRYIMWMWM